MANPEDCNEQDETRHDAEAGDLLAADGISSWIFQTEQFVLEPNTTMCAGQNSFPTAIQRHQLVRQIGVDSVKSGWLKLCVDVLFPSLGWSSLLPMPFLIDTTWLATVQDGLNCDSVESDSASSRLKHPIPPTTPIVTTTTSKPTTVGQGKAHDHDEGVAEDDDDYVTLLILSSPLVES